MGSQLGTFHFLQESLVLVPAGHRVGGGHHVADARLLRPRNRRDHQHHHQQSWRHPWHRVLVHCVVHTGLSHLSSRFQDLQHPLYQMCFNIVHCSLFECYLWTVDGGDDGILLVSTDNGLSTDWGWPLHWPSVAIPWQSPAIPVAIVAMGGQRIDTMGRVEGTGPLPLLLAGTAGHELFQNCKNLSKMWNC